MQMRCVRREQELKQDDVVPDAGHPKRKMCGCRSQGDTNESTSRSKVIKESQ